VKTIADVPWLPRPNEISMLFGKELGEPHPVRSVFGFVFDADNRLLMVRKDKGWDLPGGGRKPHETPAEALAREVLEEAAITIGDASPSAAIRSCLLHDSPPQGYRRPFPVSWEIYFRCSVVSQSAFLPNGETDGRCFMDIDAAFRQEGIRFGSRNLILQWMIDERHN
jgi:8-oxo-dGTP pyrophosphatase MutT (NUDIX family)